MPGAKRLQSAPSRSSRTFDIAKYDLLRHRSTTSQNRPRRQKIAERQTKRPIFGR
ncbi:hypothetical protein BN903_123 [Halorubrum sp. AJ67]|nr:hypothetical protein BN903_123 [Halorubrum sp. AJ67]